MKIVIIKAHEELGFKVGDRVEATAEKYEAMEAEGIAITAAQWDADQATIKANARIQASAEAAVDGAIIRARDEGKLLPKEEVKDLRDKAVKMELFEAGMGAAHIGALPVKVKDATLSARQTAPGDGTSVVIRACDPTVSELVQGYIKASEPVWRVSDRIHGGVLGGKSTDEAAIKAATYVAHEKSMFLTKINAIMANDTGGDFRMRDIVKAANYADPAANNPLGLLNSDLVLSWNLGYLENMLPMLADITTDMSNQPVKFNQNAVTRYIKVPGFQTKAAGVAWAGGAGNDVDVNVLMSRYIGIPITLSENILAATYRQLFNEQRSPQLYGLAEAILYYLVDTMVNGSTRQANDGSTSANIKFKPGYTSGAIANAFSVAPPVTAQTFLAALPEAMDEAKFPGGDEPDDAPDVQRFAWLHPKLYAALPSDAAYVLNATISRMSAQSQGNVLKTGRVGRVGNVKYSKSQLMTDQNTLAADPGNASSQVVVPGSYANSKFVGLAGTRSALLFTSRVPLDYTKVMPEIPSTAAVELGDGSEDRHHLHGGEVS